MELVAGYKTTVVGVIPKQWDVQLLKNSLLENPDYGINAPAVPYSDRLPAYLRITDITEDGQLSLEKPVSVSHPNASEYFLIAGDIVLARTGASVGKSYLYKPHDGRLVFAGFLIRVRPDPTRLLPSFLSAYLSTEKYWKWVRLMSQRSGQPGINSQEYGQLPIPVPSVHEQIAIVTVLSDLDALLNSLDQLIAKKRNLKQAAMQQLLTGKTRLPGFSGEWEMRRLGEIAECLDNFRVPLNEAQREKMQGDYPYCGANGILGFVNNYVIDDDIILMAEDGGYFDEYQTRPIAYRMSGKCWVNNHAHILKAKVGTDQTFLFYSLVNKNIQSFLASGTRAKLNKSEMNKIALICPAKLCEQTAIASILADIDAEIATIEARRDKTAQIKQGMMQELLTGRTRLV